MNLPRLPGSMWGVPATPHPCHHCFREDNRLCGACHSRSSVLSLRAAARLEGVP